MALKRWLVKGKGAEGKNYFGRKIGKKRNHSVKGRNPFRKTQIGDWLHLGRAKFGGKGEFTRLKVSLFQVPKEPPWLTWENRKFNRLNGGFIFQTHFGVSFTLYSFQFLLGLGKGHLFKFKGL